MELKNPLFLRYDMMRMDPQLVFLKTCGPPDEDEMLAAKPLNKVSDMDDDSKLDEDDDSMLSGSKTPSERASSVKPGDKEENSTSTNGQFRPFPSSSELNGRLRRLMASYQRENKREEARLAAQDRRNERRERIEQVIREREQQKMDSQNKKLNRKEENDFYRAIMAYGIEHSKDGKKIVWDRFKALARLDKKYDETMNEFYLAFMAACKKAIKEPLDEDEEACPLTIDSIEEVKAKKILARVDLIKTIRDDVLKHAKLDERLLLCEAANDLPDWWIAGKHDKDLIQGVARHGMARMDYYVLNDPELSFKDILQRHLCNEPLLDKKAAKDYDKAREKVKADMAKDKEESSEKEEKDEKENGEKDSKAEEENKKKKKVRRASVTISPPQITLQQMEQMAKGGILYDMDMMNDLMAQTYASAVKWPKDQVLAIRIEHIVKCVQTGKFPLDKGHSLGEILAELQDNDNSPFDSKSPDSNLRDSSTPLSESSDMSKGKVDQHTSKIRQLLTGGMPSKSAHDDEDDPIAR